MKRSDDIQNELKHIAPTLAEKTSTTCPPWRNPFATPDNYFNTLPQEILQRVKTEPKQIALPPSRWKEVLNIAAAVVALIIVGLTLLRNSNHQANSTNPVEHNAALNQMSDDELYNYLQVELNDIPVESIAAHVNDASLDTLENEWLALSTSYDDALLDATSLDMGLLESP